MNLKCVNEKEAMFDDQICHRRRDLQDFTLIDDKEICWLTEYRCCNYQYVMVPGKYNWIIQNSWGTGWGDNGLIRLRYEGGIGVSGMNDYIYWATVQ